MDLNVYILLVTHKQESGNCYMLVEFLPPHLLQIDTLPQHQYH